MGRPPVHLGAQAANPGGWFRGEIHTLNLDLEGPEPPVIDEPSDERPGIRITAGGANLGAAGR